MAVSTRWMLFGAVASTLIAAACGGGGGDDSGGSTSKPTVDAGTNGSGAAPMLVGAACVSSMQCATGTQCRQSQGFGALSNVGAIDSLDAPGGYCSADCAGNADCGAGGVCLAALGSQIKGECRHSCKADTDCRDGYECAAAPADATSAVTGIGLALPPSCQSKPAPDMLVDQVGKSCDVDGKSPTCGNGFCTGAYCSGACSTKDSSTCGAKAVCLSNGFYGSGGTCEQTCTADTDCTQYTPGGNIGCVDAGNNVKVCAETQLPLPAGVVGTACAEDTDCGPGQCTDVLGADSATAPDGYCTVNGCEDDTMCGGGTCIGMAGVGRCYANCTADTQCRTGYSCLDRTAATMKTAKVCAPTPVAGDGGTATGSTTDGGASSTAVDAGVHDAG